MPRISTFGGFASEMRQLSEEKQRKVKELVELTLGDIETDAISLAPGPGDRIQLQGGSARLETLRGDRDWKPISQGIGYYVEANGYKGEVFVEKSVGLIGPYVEFGTGQSAATYLSTVPAEWQSLARLYYINGKGRIIAQPFFLPAILRNEIEFHKGMDRIFR